MESAKKSSIEELSQADKEVSGKRSFRPNPRASYVRDAYSTFIGERYMKNIDEVKGLIRTAIANNEFPADVSIWGVPLLDDRWSDTVIDKFLLARKSKPEKAMAMIRNTIKWREELGIEKLMREDLGMPPEVERAVFVGAIDRLTRPVFYNVYGEFQNKDLYEKTFGDGDKRQRFFRWRIQCLEKEIRGSLDFTLHCTSQIVQVFDFKDSPVLPLITDLLQTLRLLQDHYPELLAHQIFINVPRWFLALNKIISPFLAPRTKKKFIFARPDESARTLFT